MSANDIPGADRVSRSGSGSGSDGFSGFAKIGTADFTGRVVSGLIRPAEPGSIVLRQLYPQPPADIGVIDNIEPTDSQLTIYPAHRRDWTDADRSALSFFFATRYRDHHRLAAQLGIGALASVPAPESTHG